MTPRWLRAQEDVQMIISYTTTASTCAPGDEGDDVGELVHAVAVGVLDELGHVARGHGALHVEILLGEVIEVARHDDLYYITRIRAYYTHTSI